MFKPLNLTAQVTYVSGSDPAIDWDKTVAPEIEAMPASDEPYDARRRKAEDAFIERYAMASFKDPSAWASMLKFKDGERPTEFVIGVIPPDEMNRIIDECRLGKPDADRSQAYWRAFLACVRDIKNFGGEPPPKRTVGGVEYVEPAWLGKKFARGLRSVALNAGAVGWSWNQLTEDEVKN